jgi:peptide deformylase
VGNHVCQQWRGLAAPQVNHSIRLFVVDTVQMFNNMEEEDKAEYPDDPGVKGVFINAHIMELEGDKWMYNEGCLSIPKIREDISRQEIVTLQYLDENFEAHTQTFNGLSARVILHEYDHIEGKLFIDHISALKRKLMKGRLNDISKGKVEVDYKMLFPGLILLHSYTQKNIFSRLTRKYRCYINKLILKSSGFFLL